LMMMMMTAAPTWDTWCMDQIIAGLAAATSLTMLSLQPELKRVRGCGAALAQVVPNLQQLQHLQLVQCGVSSAKCMAAIGQLTQLTELRLERNLCITQQGLMQLTGLKQLQKLGVGRTQHPWWHRDGTVTVTEDSVEQLWAALRQAA
jgi:hypothetical protein